MLKSIQQRLDKREQLKEQWLAFLSRNLELIHDCFKEDLRQWIKTNENLSRIAMIRVLETSEKKILAKEIMETFVKPKKLYSRVIMVIESLHKVRDGYMYNVLPQDKRKLIMGVKKFTDDEYQVGEMLLVLAIRPIIEYFVLYKIIEERSNNRTVDEFEYIMKLFIRRRCEKYNVDLDRIRKEWVDAGNVDVFEMQKMESMGRLILFAVAAMLLVTVYGLVYLFN
jgi:hypothetical protein